MNEKVIISKDLVYEEKHSISGKTVKRKAYINKYGILIEEWDIPAELSDIPFEEIRKRFKRVEKK